MVKRPKVFFFTFRAFQKVRRTERKQTGAQAPVLVDDKNKALKGRRIVDNIRCVTPSGFFSSQPFFILQGLMPLPVFCRAPACVLSSPLGTYVTPLSRPCTIFTIGAFQIVRRTERKQSGAQAPVLVDKKNRALKGRQMVDNKRCVTPSGFLSSQPFLSYRGLCPCLCSVVPVGDLCDTLVETMYNFYHWGVSQPFFILQGLMPLPVFCRPRWGLM